TWFTFYTGGGTAEEMTRIHGATGDEARRMAELMPPLRIDNECKVPVSEDDDPPGIPPPQDAVRHTSTTAYWMHLVLCAFRLMETQKAAGVWARRPPRPARRRAQREQVAPPAAPVRLVDITAGSVRRQQAPEGGPTGRTYHCRFFVGGHWRNQW